MGTNSHNAPTHVGVSDSEVGQLKVAERIEQHYHVESAPPAEVSLSALQFAYSTSEETLRQARFWSAVCSLPWMALTAFIWATLPHQLPPSSTSLDLLVYVMVFAFIPLTTRFCMPDHIKTKKNHWQHVIDAETQIMTDLHHRIVREKARLRVLLRG
ncbi:hypothetical protein QSH39_017350 [Xanthomonas arboricola pv. corylina]|uniref:hypothetical protein n=1 Tax=Xanthomonas arboricola TaxID=56448 RepID=UPI0025B03D2A|nr:hypothetical protein [Xanthomonas arboricola]MDN0204406.1 hypothetical protein [Xanthomonas arboricola pv. corylina]MDN0217480.1 hypothetical protein [Xanthomonas arboricola pv. corylina]